MIILPLLFLKDGFTHTQLVRRGEFAIYHRKKANQENAHYEVIQIKSHNGYMLGRNEIKAAEVYPSATNWGTHGWTFPTEADACKKLDQLTK